jgi:hypothetical protein
MNGVLRFSLPAGADAETVETDMALAIFAAECVYGKPRVRMEVSYLVEERGRACAMHISGEAGEAAARVFAGLAAARFGDEAFAVQRIQSGASDQPAEPVTA